MRYFQFFAKLFLSGIALYLVACVILFTSQRSLLYFPQPSVNNNLAKMLKIPIDEGMLQISVRPLASPKALIYFGGNAEDVSQNLAVFSAAFPEMAIYLMHYRSYGESSGLPSEQAIQQDALALFDKIYVEHQHITLIGRSLGSGVAVRLANLRPAEKLVLITPYNSLEEIAIQHYPYFPIHYLLQDKYESWRYASQIKTPILILAAEYDVVIPRANTEKLVSSFKNAIVSYKVLPDTDHNTIAQSPEYLPLLQSFLKN